MYHSYRTNLRAVFDQIAFYFSETNYPSDTFLNSISNYDGWILIRDILHFRALSKILDKVYDGRIQKFTIVQCALEMYISPTTTFEVVGDKIRYKPQKKLILDQIDYYFSDQNWNKDVYLQSLSESNGGFVPITKLLEFKRLLQIVGNTSSSNAVSLIKESLSHSNITVVVDNGVRRKILRERVLSQIELYFYPKQDRMIWEYLAENNGFVPLQVIMEFQPMKALCHIQIDPIAQIIKTHSKILQIQDSTGTVLVGLNVNLEMDMDIEIMGPKNLGEQLSFKRDMIPKRTEERVQPSFLAMTFNILSQYLTVHHQYCNIKFRSWNYRKRLILQDLDMYSPDVLGLQEVQHVGHTKCKDELFSELTSRGYQGKFLGKHSVDGKEIGKHGSSLFWKKSVFDLVKYIPILFAPLLKSLCRSQDAIDYFALPQVALAAFLKHKSTGQVILVCNTHISCEWQTPEKQIAQIHLLLQELSKLTQAMGRVPVILLGDFNSTPGSAAYELISRGQLELSIDENMPLPNLSLNEGKLIHDLKFSSAYQKILGDEPPRTNVPSDEEFTLDYVWFTQELEPTQILEIPSEQVLKEEHGGIPNSHFPSDHVPLMVRFVLPTTIPFLV